MSSCKNEDSKNSGLYGIWTHDLFTTAQIVFITVKIAFIFMSLSAVHIYDVHIFSHLFITSRFIWNQHYNQLPVGLLAKLVEQCIGIAEVMGSNQYKPNFFQGLFSLLLR